MQLNNNLLEASLKLFMKYGIKSVSMDDLARSLGISKKTIYASFKNKKELVSKVVTSFCEAEEEDIQEIIASHSNAVQQMLKIGEYIFGFLRDMKPSLVYDLKKYHPEVWKYINFDHYGNIEKTIKQNILVGQKSGLYRKTIDENIISKLYIGQSRVIFDDDLFPIDDFEKPTLFKEFFFYHLYGICTEKGRNYLTTKIDFK